MDNVKSLDPLQLNTKEVHKILLSSVAPRPIAFASTVDSKGNVNLSPFSYFNVFSINFRDFRNSFDFTPNKFFD